MAKQPKQERAAPAQPDQSPNGNDVRDRAYSIWENEGRPEGRHDEHWLQAEREIEHESSEVEGDDLPSLAALREAAREHNDTFVVASDLEDADQREASPGTREQP